MILDNELLCTEQCSVGSGKVDGADTCLYVTLIDQFGDGWGNDINYTYWMEIEGDATSAVSTSLSCSCSWMSGCVHPSALDVDQMIHMNVKDSSDDSIHWPAYFWEVHWTVQVIENGVWKEKYYGGYNTSLTFEFSASLNKFEAVSFMNVWKPEQDMSCDVELVVDSSSFLESRWYVDNGSSRPYSLANETTSGGGYHESVWVVTDAQVCV